MKFIKKPNKCLLITLGILGFACFIMCVPYLIPELNAFFSYFAIIGIIIFLIGIAFNFITVRCPYCKGYIRSFSKYCPHCGNELD